MDRIRDLARISVILLALFAISPFRLAAQDTNDPTIDQGLKPFGSFNGGDFDKVILENGKLNIRIPLISYPQRGGKLHAGFFVSVINPYEEESQTTYGYPPVTHTTYAMIGTGVQIEPDFPVGLGIVLDTGGNQHFAAATSDGTQHGFQATATGFITQDATGFIYNSGTNILMDRAGTRYSGFSSTLAEAFGSTSAQPPLKIEDSNGNYITAATSGTSVGSWTDTMGRTLAAPWTASTTTNYSGCVGPLTTSSAQLWNLPGLSGGTLTFKICYANVLVTAPAPGCTPPNCQAETNHPVSMIQSIVNTSDETAWIFQYSSDGILGSVTLPTGGSISWGWSNAQYKQTSGLNTFTYFCVTSRTETDGNGTAYTTTYQGTTDNFSSSSPHTVTVIDPLMNQTVHTLSPEGGYTNTYETETQFYQNQSGSQVLLKTVNTAYQVAGANDPARAATEYVPTTVTTTWANGTNNTSQTVTTYDTGIALTGGESGINAIYGQVVKKTESAYGPGSPGAVLRTTNTTYQTSANSSYLTNNLLDLISSQSITGTGNSSSTSYAYDGTSLATSGISTGHEASPAGTYRGNQTSISRSLTGSTVATTSCPKSVTNGSVVSYINFYDTGAVSSSVNACGSGPTDSAHMTSFLWNSSYVGAYVTQVTDPLGHITKHAYDLNTGLRTSTTDPNNAVTTFSYNPDRLIYQIKYPNTSTATFSYNLAYPFRATVTQTATPSPNYVKTDTYDGFARQITTNTATPADSTCLSGISSEIVYDGLGRKSTETNPHCSTAKNSDGTTTYSYDALNRSTQVQKPDGSISTTSYCGASGLATDEAGHWRRSTNDALGRLIEVDEPNSPTATATACSASADNVTTYGYDVLDNLTSSIQAGQRQRTFAYDTLSRLTSTTNPESGTITYKYDNTGNAVSKTDARSIISTYQYDTDNRVTQKSYSDGTPTMAYLYDASSTNGETITNPIGRLVRAESADGTIATVNDYDNMGHVIYQWQWPPLDSNGDATEFNFTYDLLGNLATYTNGSSFVFTQVFDAARRVTSLSSSLVDSQHPATLATVSQYWPSGSPELLQYGNSLSEIRFLNNRLQTCRVNVNTGTPTLTSCTSAVSGGTIQDFYIQYGIGPHNNGTVAIFDASDNENFTRSYTYDQVNRLSTMTDTYTSQLCKGEQWTYDIWGNRQTESATSGTCNSSSLAFGTNNRITTSGYTYDAAGNLTADGSHTYAYDAESRITKVDGGSTATYVYDALGHRVQKIAGGSTTDYYYDFDGNVSSELTQGVGLKVAYIYIDGALVALYENNTTNFVHRDHEGSTRVVTSVTGTILDSLDYGPFGEQNLGDTTTSHKFTGKERDSESGLDNFEARYYGSAVGRFMSPDWAASPEPVPYSKLDNPQSLNLYVYVMNDPISDVDPDGHNSDCPGGGTACNESPAATSTPQQTSTEQSQGDPTLPPPPPTPDPAGVRTDPAANPSSPNPSSANTPADPAQAPMESRGQQPKGERGTTRKPEFKPKPGKLPKGVRPKPGKQDEYQVKDPHTGNWVDKPKGWSPYAKAGIGAAIATGAVIAIRALAGCFASGLCEAAAL